MFVDIHARPVLFWTEMKEIVVVGLEQEKLAGDEGGKFVVKMLKKNSAFMLDVLILFHFVLLYTI